jgi:hypothetical protein
MLLSKLLVEMTHVEIEVLLPIQGVSVGSAALAEGELEQLNEGLKVDLGTNQLERPMFITQVVI